MSQIATIVFAVLFATAALVAVAITVIRGLRGLRQRRRAVRAQRPRRLLLAIAAGGEEEDVAALARMPPRDWKAVEPTAFELLGKVRGEAREALAEVFVQRGLVARARRDLGRAGAVRRARAAGALGSIGDVAAVPDLCRLLGDPHPDVRVAAIHALGRIGDPAAAEPLLDSLTTTHPAPSQLVAHALTQLGPSIVPTLVGGLTDISPLVRTTALDALRLLGAAEAEQRVAALLAGDPSPEVRLRAATTLGGIGSRAALPYLLSAAEPAQQPELRAAAARALGDLGAVVAVAPLRTLLSSPDHRTAHEAAAALLKLGPDGTTTLEEAAAGTDRAAAHAREALAVAALARQQRSQRQAARVGQGV